mmetsp:Transcript_28101/g.90591  ORF Transcript_28101/g.90591 Transcript_28101/m.90591 type:complete len:220 (+) Transcript_28101:388-1047(+)
MGISGRRCKGCRMGICCRGGAAAVAGERTTAVSVDGRGDPCLVSFEAGGRRSRHTSRGIETSSCRVAVGVIRRESTAGCFGVVVLHFWKHADAAFLGGSRRRRKNHPGRVVAPRLFLRFDDVRPLALALALLLGLLHRLLPARFARGLWSERTRRYSRCLRGGRRGSRSSGLRSRPDFVLRSRRRTPRTTTSASPGFRWRFPVGSPAPPRPGSWRTRCT